MTASSLNGQVHRSVITFLVHVANVVYCAMSKVNAHWKRKCGESISTRSLGDTGMAFKPLLKLWITKD